MRISPVSVNLNKSSIKCNPKPTCQKTKLDGPVEQPTTDVVAFKGVKNALRAGSLYALAGAAVGAFAMPAMGVAGGAALLGGILAAVGILKGAPVDDKENIFNKTDA